MTDHTSLETLDVAEGKKGAVESTSSEVLDAVVSRLWLVVSNGILLKDERLGVSQNLD